MNQPSIVKKTTSTKLARVELKARENPDEIFSNLGHILSLEHFEECFNSIDGNKAIGIDNWCGPKLVDIITCKFLRTQMVF